MTKELAFIVYLLGPLLVQQAAAGLFGSHNDELAVKSFIDHEPLNQQVLSELCSDPTKRISKISTISWFLKELELSISHSECQQQYLKPLKALDKVVSSHADNVCSLEKAKLVDLFHWNYLMGATSSKWTQFAEGILPEPLKAFFLHYVIELTTLCKVSLLKNIELVSAQKDLYRAEANLLDGQFGRIIDGFQKVLIPFKKIKHYDNFVLLWDMIINHERKKNKAQLGGMTFDESPLALIKVKEASNVWKAQAKCREYLKPVYRDTVLPVMKLIDMGYSSKDKQLDKEMKANGEQRKRYMLTQTCELILPIKFYEDKNMKSFELGTMDSFDEASRYTEEPEGENELAKMPRIQAPGVSLRDELKSALISDESKLLKLVKSNTQSRGHLYRKMVHNFMGTILARGFSGHKQLIAMVKKLRTSSNKQSVADEELVYETMKDTDQYLEENEKLDSEQQPPLLRAKRDIEKVTESNVDATTETNKVDDSSNDDNEKKELSIEEKIKVLKRVILKIGFILFIVILVVVLFATGTLQG